MVDTPAERVLQSAGARVPSQRLEWTTDGPYDNPLLCGCCSLLLEELGGMSIDSRILSTSAALELSDPTLCFVSAYCSDNLCAVT